jgi:small ligand-binding sensory domain FIST
MRFFSGISDAQSPDDMVQELTASATGLEGATDLVAFFFTGPLRESAAPLAAMLQERLRPRVLVGVSCESVAGGDRELEFRPAASLVGAHLPNVDLRPFHVSAAEWSTLLSDPEQLQQRIGTGERHCGQLLLADPFTTPVDELLGELDRTFGASTFGGMASGAQSPGGNLLLLNGSLYSDGAVGVGFGGDVTIDCVVSQGCRPFGDPMVVTRAQENLIQELGRKPALEVAREMLERLSPEEQSLLQNGLFVGIVIDEYRSEFRRGDFLVRGLMGYDPSSGALAVGDHVRAGQTIQFHLRDAGTAHEDLSLMLRERAEQGYSGGMLFTCNGRGSRMFDVPHHDVRTIHEGLPGLPVAGFFAMGELGPVGGKSFIHGHTASLALFRPGS